VAALKSLKVPEDWRERMTMAVAELLGDQQLEERLSQIRDTIERMDFRWDHGFITDADEYLEKRLALQQELEQMMPIPEEDLAIAADLIENFGLHWEAAQEDPAEQERLLKLMLVRVWVEGDAVVRLCLRPNLHVTAGLDAKRPTEISVDLDCYQSGSDGRRILLLQLRFVILGISRQNGPRTSCTRPVFMPHRRSQTVLLPLTGTATDVAVVLCVRAA
jgi:hypothetical protein